MNEKETLNSQIQELLKKYKMTMWALVACIALYLVFLFVVKAEWSTWVVLVLCIIMIVLAVLNTRYSRAIQKLAKQRQQILKQEKSDSGELSAESAQASEIVANAKTLNDLPREYTVLDNVELDGKTAEHIVVSPYGIAVVASEDLTLQVQDVLVDLGIQSPVRLYSPDEDIAVMAEQIQMDKEPALDESQIMSVLYRLTGLKN